MHIYINICVLLPLDSFVYFIYTIHIYKYIYYDVTYVFYFQMRACRSANKIVVCDEGFSKGLAQGHADSAAKIDEAFYQGAILFCLLDLSILAAGIKAKSAHMHAQRFHFTSPSQDTQCRFILLQSNKQWRSGVEKGAADCAALHGEQLDAAFAEGLKLLGAQRIALAQLIGNSVPKPKIPALAC